MNSSPPRLFKLLGSYSFPGSQATRNSNYQLECHLFFFFFFFSIQRRNYYSCASLCSPEVKPQAITILLACIFITDHLFFQSGTWDTIVDLFFKVSFSPCISKIRLFHEFRLFLPVSVSLLKHFFVISRVSQLWT